MKEAGRERGGGINGNGRSAVERERTKMRERQRRSITTNIFHGLRKHGGYRLSPRADINEVLRQLAQEAGWIVEPDGTTYRSPTTTTISNGTTACPLCGAGRKSAPTTPSCSYFGGAGECSTTTSPRHVTVADSAVNNLSSGGVPSLSSTSVMATNDTLLAIYMCGAAPQNTSTSEAACGKEQQQLYMVHEAGVSNQSTPAGST